MARTAGERDELIRALKQDAVLVLLQNALETERAIARLYEVVASRAALADVAERLEEAQDTCAHNARALEGAMARVGGTQRAVEIGPPPVCTLVERTINAPRDGVLGTFLDLLDALAVEAAAEGNWEVIRELARDSGSPELLRVSEDIQPREEAHMQFLREKGQEAAREIFLFAESEVASGEA